VTRKQARKERKDCRKTIWEINTGTQKEHREGYGKEPRKRASEKRRKSEEAFIHILRVERQRENGVRISRLF
jgi:hypothetical protein